MKIIIVGAGIAGLSVANFLSNKHDVTIYESKNKDELLHDWYDNVNNNIMKKVGLSTTIYPNTGVMISPDQNCEIYFSSKEGSYTPLYRKDFLINLRSQIPFKINYETPVELDVINGKVNGIIVNDEKIPADLVIDCSGLSNLKTVIGNKIDDKDYFTTYRLITKNICEDKLKYDNYYYLKHCHNNGVSWLAVSPNNTVDILIGKIGNMTMDEIGPLLDDLIKNHMPTGLGNKVYEGLYKVPVRYPASIMCDEKYVALGDSVFMTIPLHGSGITNILQAAHILTTILNEKENITLDDLWQYQVEYFKNIAPTSVATDVLKRWLLGVEDDKINKVFKSNIINSSDIDNLLSGDFIKLDLSNTLQKAKSGIAHPILLMELLKTFIRANQAANIAKQIPIEYDKEKCLNWQRKLEKIIK